MAVHPEFPRAQRGITLIGLILWGIIIAFGALIVMRVFPTVNEYWTILRAINKIAQTRPSTVQEVRTAFEKQKDIEYSISSIEGKDLAVTKQDDRVVISFGYDKEVPLFEPVFLLIKYRGEAKAPPR